MANKTEMASKPYHVKYETVPNPCDEHMTITKISKYYRGKKDPVVTTKYEGSKRVVDRFLKYGNFKPRQGPEVFIEQTVKCQTPMHDYNVEMAKANGWSDIRINAIRSSKDPTALYMNMYKDTYYGDNWKKLPAGERKAIIQRRRAYMISQGECPGEIKSGEGSSLREALKKRIQESSGEEKESGAPKSLLEKLRMRMGDRGTRREQEADSTIYVSNIPIDYTENTIKEIMASETEFNIKRVNIVRKPCRYTGKKVSVGSGFIVCSSPEETSKCIDYLNGCRWGSMVISANMADSKKA